jgi:hypothetical protein
MILPANIPLISAGAYILENTPPPGGGGNKYGLMGKKYHENNARADNKGEKERKDKGKEKISDKMTEQEQFFIKLWETWKKNAGNRGHNIIFFTLLF